MRLIPVEAIQPPETTTTANRVAALPMRWACAASSRAMAPLNVFPRRAPAYGDAKGWALLAYPPDLFARVFVVHQGGHLGP